MEKEPLRGGVGGMKMEHQKTLIDVGGENEVVIPKEPAEAEIDEPFGLEDALYEEWRDEISNRRKE